MAVAPGAMAALSQSASRAPFQGLLLLALAVAQLNTIPEVDGAACFLPRLLAPFAEAALGNSR